MSRNVITLRRALPPVTGFGVHASRSTATALLDELSELVDFVIIDGGKIGATDTTFREVLGYQRVIVDRFGSSKRVATPDQPLDIQTDGLFPQTLDELLAGESSSSSPVIIPVGFLEAGARAALRTILEVAHKFAGHNVLLRLPLHIRWFSGPDLELLIAVLNDAPVPFALCPGGDPQDPLSTARALSGLIQVALRCPQTQIWRTDLAGLGGFSFGASGFSFGMGSKQRHSLAPGQFGIRNPSTDKRPSRLVEDLHRWRTAANLDASEVLYTCETCCEGNSLRALTDDQALRHNLLTARRIFERILQADPHTRPSVYFQVLCEARQAHIADGSITLEPQLASWLKLFEDGIVEELLG